MLRLRFAKHTTTLTSAAASSSSSSSSLLLSLSPCLAYRAYDGKTSIFDPPPRQAMGDDMPAPVPYHPESAFSKMIKRRHREILFRDGKNPSVLKGALAEKKDYDNNNAVPNSGKFGKFHKVQKDQQYTKISEDERGDQWRSFATFMSGQAHIPEMQDLYHENPDYNPQRWEAKLKKEREEAERRVRESGAGP